MRIDALEAIKIQFYPHQELAMRYICPDCFKWVKDKMLFGTLHVCVTDNEKSILSKNPAYIRMREIANQVNSLQVTFRSVKNSIK